MISSSCCIFFSEHLNLSLYSASGFFQVPWPGSGGNEKFFFENEAVSSKKIHRVLTHTVFS